MGRLLRLSTHMGARSQRTKLLHLETRAQNLGPSFIISMRRGARLDVSGAVFALVLLCAARAATVVEEVADEVPRGWLKHTIPQGNLTREYWVYTPSSRPIGLMMFFHGDYMTNDFPDGGQIAPWEVAHWAELHGFLGVVPKGSPCTDTHKPLFHWNVNNEQGPNEVEFAHSVMRAVTASHTIPAGAPKIVLGFSNGAAVADLLGCHDGSKLYVAHVGVYYHPSADFPSTCKVEADPCSKWAGVGTQDPFISTIGVAGLRQQFSHLHDDYRCSTDPPINSSGASSTCWHYPQCAAPGELCIYENTGHEIKPAMTSDAWKWLSGVAGAARC